MYLARKIFLFLFRFSLNHTHFAVLIIYYCILRQKIKKPKKKKQLLITVFLVHCCTIDCWNLIHNIFVLVCFHNDFSLKIWFLYEIYGNNIINIKIILIKLLRISIFCCCFLMKRNKSSCAFFEIKNTKNTERKCFSSFPLYQNQRLNYHLWNSFTHFEKRRPKKKKQKIRIT